jgi:N-ethylmaleimide reductase
MSQPLFQPIKIGNIELKNRIAMAPLTRSRAGRERIPNEMMAEHYAQRASAGLLIAEATQISKQAVGYPATPGIHEPEQIEGWKKVTKAVHKKGGKIFIQLWHVGRHSHPYYLNGELPVAPSSILEEGGSIKTYEQPLDTVTPRELTITEIEEIVNDFAQAAENAIEADFDGVEIHGANGYLIEQFLYDGTNRRNDRYGGSIENRARFLFEVVERTIEKIGNNRTAIRISPSSLYHGVTDSNPLKVHEYLISKLSEYQLAYLHLIEPLMDVSKLPNYLKEVTPYFRRIYDGILMTNGGFTKEKANFYIENGLADMVAFGKDYISNPDLVERFKQNTPLQPWDKSTFYTFDEKGYNDYPSLQQ